MNIEKINYENSLQYIKRQNSVGESDKQHRIQSLQETRYRMQIDPAYEPTLQEKSILKATKEISEKLLGQNIEIEISFHETTKEPMMKLVNRINKEVVREIPSEKIVDMIVNMCELAGLYIDVKK